MKALSIPGLVSNYEIAAIYEWAREFAPGSVMVEIGSLWGRSAVAWAEGAPTSTVHCIDEWPGTMCPGEWVLDLPLVQRREHNIPDPFSYPMSLSVFRRFTQGFPNIQAHTANICRLIPWGQLDAVWIDAAHANPSDWEYIEFFFPFIRPGGWIGGHDLASAPHHPRFPDIEDNVNRLAALTGNPVERPKDTTLWRIRKPAGPSLPPSR